MNSFLKRNLSVSTAQAEDSGFLISNAYEPKSGQIIFMNSALRKLLGAREESLRD